jgi:L-2-aminoadipate reductase
MPLYHFVTADLPSSTVAPELDDTNASIALASDMDWTRDAGNWRIWGVDEETLGVYLAYLVEIGFMPTPIEGKGKALPAVELQEGQKEALSTVGGRGSLV